MSLGLTRESSHVWGGVWDAAAGGVNLCVGQSQNQHGRIGSSLRKQQHLARQTERIDSLKVKEAFDSELATGS